MERIADKLIHNNQTAFMRGRNIMTGIMCLHETLHETRRRNEIGVILKLNFEKAYDKVNWNLLFDCLEKKALEISGVNGSSRLLLGDS
jgi:hypothetical protein